MIFVCIARHEVHGLHFQTTVRDLRKKEASEKSLLQEVMSLKAALDSKAREVGILGQRSLPFLGHTKKSSSSHRPLLSSSSATRSRPRLKASPS